MAPHILRDYVIFTIDSGARLQGIPTPDAPVTVHQVYVPPARDILLGKQVDYVVRRCANPNATDKESFRQTTRSLLNFTRRLCEGDLQAWETVFAPERAFRGSTPPLGRLVLANVRTHANRVLSKQMPELMAQVDAAIAPFVLPTAQQEAVQYTTAWLSTLPMDQRLCTRSMGALKRWVASSHSPWLTFKAPHAGKGEPHMLEVGGVAYPLDAKVGVWLEALSVQAAELSAVSQAAVACGRADPSALGRALCMVQEALELLTQRTITLPRPNASYLQMIMGGGIAPEIIARVLTFERAQLDTAIAQADLPDLADAPWIEDLVARVYQEQVHLNVAPYLGPGCQLQTPHTQAALRARRLGPSPAVPPMTTCNDLLVLDAADDVAG